MSSTTKDIAGSGAVTALVGLDTLGVSLVKRGANKKTFAVVKAAEETDMNLTETLKNIVAEGTIEDAAKVEAVAKAEKLTEKGTEALKAVVKMAEAFKDEPGLLAAIVKSMQDGSSDESVKGKSKKAKGKAQIDDDGEEPGDDPEMESKKALAKSLEAIPAAVRAQLEPILKAQQSQVEAAKAQVAQLQAIVKAETDARMEREWLTKAEKHLTHVPGKKPAELAKVLKGLADVSADVAAQQFELLKAASDAVRKSAMLGEIGRSPAAGGEIDAWGEIQALADQLVQKSTSGLSQAEAIAKAMEMKPELYDRYMAEQRMKVRGF